MSEQNILNPTNTSFLNPAFGYDDGIQMALQEFMADSGKYSSRLGSGLGRTFNLQWKGIPDASAAALRQWEMQYRQGFFSLADYDRSRYFTGHFKGPLRFTNAGNQSKNVSGVFEELCGLPMFQYPTSWGVDSVFVEERDDFGQDTLKFNGPAGVIFTSATCHGGAAYNINSGTSAEWIYFGYGFRLWAPQGSDRGIGVLSVTRVSDGTVMLAATNVDQYLSAFTNSNPLHTEANYPLDFYRVKLLNNGTKNGASSANNVFVDAIEVME